jgi:hypothetical protein
LVVVVVVVVVKMSLRILGKDALVWPRKEEGRKAIIRIVILIIVGVVLAKPSPKDRAALGAYGSSSWVVYPLITAATTLAAAAMDVVACVCVVAFISFSSSTSRTLGPGRL